MKSDIEIKDDVYNVLKTSLLKQTADGKLTKRERPLNSDKEDICISVASNAVTLQTQEAIVYVRVFARDVYNKENGQMESDDARLRTLATQSYNALNFHHGGNWRWQMSSQHIEKVNGADQHVIINRLVYRIINDL